MIALGLLAVSLAEARPRVIVVQSDDLGPYTDPVPAFLETIGEPALVVNLHGRRSEADALIARLQREESPRVVFALGAKAAYAVREGLPEVPMVYTAINQPERYGIGDDDHTWGVQAMADPVAYLSQMLAFFPEVRRVGWMRGPAVSEARVADLRAAADAVGVTLVVREVESARGVRKAIDAMGPEIDALWVPPDRDLLTTETFRVLGEESRRRHLPLLVPTDNMVRAGGLFAVVPDASGLGRLAGEQANAILEGNPPPDAVVYSDALKVALNLRTLDLAEIGLDTLLLDFVDIRVE